MVFYTKALRSAAYKRLAVVALLAANAFSAWADNRLYIKDFTILSGGEYVVSVQFENGGTKKFLPKYQKSLMLEG